MNQNCFERKRSNRLARPPPATVLTTSRWLPQILWRNRGQLRLDKRVPPPTFTIASPGSGEGEAMVKAGGGEGSVIT
jgi:hypothetical protein